MAASWAAIFSASAWWLAAARRSQGGIGLVSRACPTVYIQCDLVGRAAGGDVALIAGYIAAWQPSSVPRRRRPSFARPVAARAGPGTRARANALLWAAARLAAFSVPLGLEPVPGVLLHPSVIERFAASAPGLSGSARRTLRTNLRFLARRVVPALAPADASLPRERAKAPVQPGRDRRVPGAG